MAIIVVGGHSRNIGKTSVVAGLIASFPEYGWTAIKITQFGHGICAIDGKECACAVTEHSYAIQEEHIRDGETDTSRFLTAGAQRSLWVRTKQGELASVMPKLRPIIESDSFVIIESNSILQYVAPDLYIVVLRFDVEDFKQSARQFYEKAQAAVMVQSDFSRPSWNGISEEPLKGLPWFYARPTEFVSPDLRAFVGARLEAIAGGKSNPSKGLVTESH